jgi:hypothetical protein
MFLEIILVRCCFSAVFQSIINNLQSYSSTRWVMRDVLDPEQYHERFQSVVIL